MTQHQIIYAKFEDFEEQLARCYFVLHGRFIANPPLAKFWAETTMQELQHSSTLRFCRERSLVANADIDFKTVDHVEELLDTVKGIVSDPNVSIDEAFYASLLIESSELEEIYDNLIGALAKDYRLLLDAIHASLLSHHATLADAAEKFCNDRGFAKAFRNLARKD
jgi:hypothetical protein